MSLRLLILKPSQTLEGLKPTSRGVRPSCASIHGRLLNLLSNGALKTLFMMLPGLPNALLEVVMRKTTPLNRPFCIVKS